MMLNVQVVVKNITYTVIASLPSVYVLMLCSLMIAHAIDATNCEERWREPN
tara:strand:- start:965 stop:1117 length:153 start_codon:yes stop_codon:yes gene_type:complete